jgi:hypothetical protein
MPFKSEAQRRFMYAQHPKIAKRWQKHTGKGAELPEKVSKKAAYELGFEVGCKQAARGGNPFAALQSLWRVFARNRAAQATMKKIPARPPTPAAPAPKTPVQTELERMQAEHAARSLKAKNKNWTPTQRMGGV